jgi:phosphonate transport system substrate-binding protein
MAKVPWLIGIGMVSLFLTGAVVYLSQSNPARSAKRISLQPSLTEPVSPPQQTDRLRIAVGAIISPVKSLTFDYIGEKLGRGVEMVQRKTYAEVNFLIKERRIDAAFVCSRPYVEGHRNFGMELLCVPVCFGKTEYCSYFIVHKDSTIRLLEDLRGKLFAFSDPLSNTGTLIPTYTLAKMGETPESFFRRYIFTYSHDNSIRSRKILKRVLIDRFTVIEDGAYDSIRQMEAFMKDFRPQK